MAPERLPMRSIREILRQKWELGRSNRTVAQSVGVSVGAVGGMLHRERAAGLSTWAAVAPLSDDALAAAIYRRAAGAGRGRPHPDFAALHTERRKPGVTIQFNTDYRPISPNTFRAAAGICVPGPKIAFTPAVSSIL